MMISLNIHFKMVMGAAAALRFATGFAAKIVDLILFKTLFF